MEDCLNRFKNVMKKKLLNRPSVSDWVPLKIPLKCEFTPNVQLIEQKDEAEKNAKDEKCTDPKKSYSEELKELCAKLNCPQKSFQIEKLAIAWENMIKLQQEQTSNRILQEYVSGSFGCEEGEEEAGMSHEDPIPLHSETIWHGYFKDYEILNKMTKFGSYQLKNCIELGHRDTVGNMEAYLRSGARCFIIDLFRGNAHRNQMVIVRFRLSELNVASELGYPITSTLFARLSPRLQYTGYLAESVEWIMLCKKEIVLLTTDRCWADNCTKNRIYVNARTLLEDIYPNDIILVGTEIQLVVQKVVKDYIRCKVIATGKLRSRMPVVFPGRCARFHISLCELEDITFAREVGINVIVSDMVGTQAYFDNLTATLKLLDCSHLRVFARIVVNNMDGEQKDIKWAIQAYDGFIGEPSLFRYGCGGDGNIADIDDKKSPRILFVSPSMREFLDAAHAANKAFVFDLTLLIDGWFVLDPISYRSILYHPDKYLVPSHRLEDAEMFFMFVQALGFGMPEVKIGKIMPYCDSSHTGSDSLALSMVAATFEMQATCIFVVGHTGRMAVKISTFRPKANIFFITELKSAANYISIYHNVMMLYYKPPAKITSHQKMIYIQFLYALSYAAHLNSLRHGDKIVFVYGQSSGQQYPDKYATYKFDEKKFIQDLPRFLF